MSKSYNSAIWAERIAECMDEYPAQHPEQYSSAGGILTQKELANLAGVSPATLSSWMGNGKGKRYVVPTADNLRKIADVFGVTLDYLMGRTKTKSPDENIQCAAKTTGLSETAIMKLRDMTGGDFDLFDSALNAVLESDEFRNLVVNLLCAAKSSISDALEFNRYSNDVKAHTTSEFDDVKQLTNSLGETMSIRDIYRSNFDAAAKHLFDTALTHLDKTQQEIPKAFTIPKDVLLNAFAQNPNIENSERV